MDSYEDILKSTAPPEVEEVAPRETEMDEDAQIDNTSTIALLTRVVHKLNFFDGFLTKLRALHIIGVGVYCAAGILTLIDSNLIQGLYMLWAVCFASYLLFLIVFQMLTWGGRGDVSKTLMCDLYHAFLLSFLITFWAGFWLGFAGTLLERARHVNETMMFVLTLFSACTGSFFLFLLSTAAVRIVGKLELSRDPREGSSGPA